MKTAFATGRGFYAANTHKGDRNVAPGDMRFYCARIEAYDGQAKAGTADADTSFKLLVAMAEGKPEVAAALLALHGALGANLEVLKAYAKR